MSPPLHPIRAGLLVLGGFVLSTLAAGRSSTTWRMMQVENVRVLSDLSERDLEDLHRDVFYFNQAMIKLFGHRYVGAQEPIYAIVTKSKNQLDAYLGERAENIAGVYLRRAGMEMLIAQAARDSDYAREVLFHEMTHRHLNGINPPAWMNEGVAELFERVQVKRKVVEVGHPNPHWVDYHRNYPQFYRLDFDRFFAVTTSSDHYQDSDKAVDFYARAWLFAHYCWFGKSELKRDYLALGATPSIQEDTFFEQFGFDFAELDRRLRGYAETGRYSFFRLPIEDMEPLPAPDIRLASSDEFDAFHARALFLTEHLAEARPVLEALPGEDLMVAENRAILALMDEDQTGITEWLGKAVALGTRNPNLLSEAADRRFRALLSESNGTISAEDARDLLVQLKPLIRFHRKNPRGVRTMILVLDAAQSAAPQNLLEIFGQWEAAHGAADSWTKNALDRIRERSGAG